MSLVTCTPLPDSTPRLLDPVYQSLAALSTLAVTRFEELNALAAQQEVVFRVWDITSAIKLRARQNQFYGGFSASPEEFQSMDYDQFVKDTYGVFATKTWENDFSIRPVVLQHVTGKSFKDLYGVLSAGRLAKMDVGKEPSPWISATASLRWAVEETNRRLTLDPGRTVHITVIDPKFHLHETHVPADDILRRYQKEMRRMKGHPTYGEIVRAAERAEVCQEVLFYGRIFGASVKEDMSFFEPVFLDPVSMVHIALADDIYQDMHAPIMMPVPI
jgi:hypothetical protein